MTTYSDMLTMCIQLRTLMNITTECEKPKHIADIYNEAVKRELIPRGLYDRAMQILMVIYSRG